MWLKRYISDWCSKLAQAYDFAVDSEVQRFIKNSIQLENYGTEFVISKESMPLNEQEAKDLCASAVALSPSFEQYILKLRWHESIGEKPSRYSVLVTMEQGVLYFEHIDIKFPLNLESLGAKAVNPHSMTGRGRSNHQKRMDERKQKLQSKLSQIENTDDMTYMMHANQCGYLAKHTKMRFWFLPGSEMWGTSVMTQVSGLSLDDLRGFVDAAGQPTLANIDVRSESFRREKESAGTESIEQTSTGVLATHMAFASALMDFMNLEFVVDPVSIAAQVKASSGDTKFRPISEWGGTPDVILKRLAERKPNLNPKDIEDYFLEGYQEGNLLT